LSLSDEVEISGRVVAVRGVVVEATLPIADLGAICEIGRSSGAPIIARVVGFNEERVTLAPLDSVAGVCAGLVVRVKRGGLKLDSRALRPGSIVDCFGAPLDQDGEVAPAETSSPCWRVRNPVPNPLKRLPIERQFWSGVKAIDGLLPLGVGQRVGLFAPAGAGKSTLLGMLARNAAVDVVVVALIGERGREVREFLDDCLTPDARARTILVVATSDESAARRYMAAETATSIAEYHRAQGHSVLLLLDSLTRVARALREISLAAGELPVRQGYTATVYSELPVLLERSGNDDCGSITALYTVLMNGENEADPLSDEIKSLLDGHLVLGHGVAARGLRPAIDLPQSISRVASQVVSREELVKIETINQAFARLKKDRDLAAFGGHVDEELKTLIKNEPKCIALLTQTNQDTNLSGGPRSIAALRDSLLQLIRAAN
jgi:type III secretion protein N (ATPase)